MDQNKFFLLKFSFQLLPKTDALRVQIMRNKYNMCENLSDTITQSNCSFIWRSLMKVWLEVISNIYWSIGDGRFVNFWNDVWIKMLGPLRRWHT